MINYGNKKFIGICNSIDYGVGNETIFYYSQDDNIVSAKYSGGNIIAGMLIGLVNKDGSIKSCYQHIDNYHIIRAGECKHKLEILEDGRYRLYESWQWTNGDLSTGNSIVEEVILN